MQPMDVVFGLAELYRRELGEEAQAMWAAAVGDCDLTELRQAAGVWMKQSRWMPTPAELLDLIQVKRNEQRRERDREHAREEHRINWTQAVRSTFNIPHGMRLLDYVDQEMKSGRSLDAIVNEVCEPNRREA